MSFGTLSKGGLRNPEYQKNRDILQAYANMINEDFGHGELTKMVDFFPGWPYTELETWADEYNTAFIVKCEVFYEASTMQAILAATILGMPDVSWDEYYETFDQATVMHKLKSNL